jgi:hypothetical protein
LSLCLSSGNPHCRQAEALAGGVRSSAVMPLKVGVKQCPVFGVNHSPRPPTGRPGGPRRRHIPAPPAPAQG